MLLAALADVTLQKIAVGRLEGLSNAEIAHELRCAVRTVERKLERIRAIWTEAGLGPE
jgi:DNA-directed RNA polymerase specialized sigma24 family protein